MNNLRWGLDPQYRPSSYFWAREHGISLISDIKGAQRRKLYQAALQSDCRQPLDPVLLQHQLAQDERRYWGRMHPAFMGGEYLPTRRPGEVEIARITIASTTQDVTCVYARAVGQRIHYRLVDEYGSATLGGRAHRTSVRPLTLEELSEFFLKGWDLRLCLQANFEDYGYPREEVHGFIVEASSSFYGEFGDWIHALIDEWLDEVTPEAENEED
jgi:hypothetical protein